jgi:AraC family transcriptional regulator
VSQLAAMTGMSRAKFTESFKCSTGMSPYKFVIERRTLMAKKLLGHSNLSLSSIAHTVGFSSQSHMTSTFRRLAGITPQAYRAWQKPRRGEDGVKSRGGTAIGRGL